MAPPSTRSMSVAERLGAVALDLTVVETRWVLDGLRSIRAAGDLAGFDPVAGQDVMVAVPTEQGRERWRRYTVRAIDRAGDALELWVSTETPGPGARWAREAAAGDPFEAVGPRGKVRVDGTVDTHLFVADTAGLAAMLAMAESVGTAQVRTVALLDAVPVGGAPDVGVDVAVAHGAGGEEGALAAVRALLAEPDGPDAATTAAYVFAELSFMRRAAALLGELGVTEDRIAAKPYWRADEANLDHGEPDKAER